MRMPKAADYRRREAEVIDTAGDQPKPIQMH